MKAWFSGMAVLLSCLFFGGGCAPPKALEVRQIHLSTTELADLREAPMIRSEQQQLFYGAIGLREREQRLGHYYTADWQDGGVGTPVVVKFEYLQSATGSQVHVQQAKFASDQTRGRAEFKVIGSDYLKNGRVLAWKCTVLRGGREVAHHQSYLWQ